MIACDTGVFIAVDSYTNLGSAKTLSASASACRLAAHFQHLQPNKTWKLVSESADFLPNRSDIINLFAKWVTTVSPGTAGLLYYSGHGIIVGGKGLVLCSRDWLPSIPYDSGIPLSRLFQIINEIGHRGANFLFIVDACRSGTSQIANELPPENVVVIFSCPIGEHALENDVSSSFVESFFRSILRCVKTRMGSNSYINLGDLIKQQTIAIRETSGGLVSGIEYQGAKSAAILIPAGEQELAFYKTLPSIALKSRPIPTSIGSRAPILRRLKECLNQIIPGHHNINNNIQKFYSESSSDLTIQIKLPALSPLHPPQSELNFVLSACPYIFETLTLEWSAEINEGWIRRASRVGSFEYRVLPNRRQFLLTWPDGFYEGQGLVAIVGKGRTNITITCQSKDQHYNNYLENLPTLGNVYDTLITAITNY